MRHLGLALGIIGLVFILCPSLALAEDRVKWVGKDENGTHTFNNTAIDTWALFVKKPSGKIVGPINYTEVKRTAEYIELEGKVDNDYVRLYKNKAFFKSDKTDGKWFELAVVGWRSGN